MAWLPIIGTILSLCHISPARAFLPFILSGVALKSFQQHVPLLSKTHRQNSPAALNSCHTYSTTAMRLLCAKYLPGSLNHNPVSLSHCRLPAISSLRTPLPSHRKNHQRAPLKFPRYIPERRVLYVPAESDRQTHSPLQASPLLP